MTTREPRTARSAPPDEPVLEIVVGADGRGSINGRTVVASSEIAARDQLLAEATRCAGVVGGPLRVRALDPHGVWHLIAHPDGAVTAVEAPPPAAEHGVEAAPAPQAGHGPAPAGNPTDAPYPDLDQPADDAGGWHLRVHPDGSITPVDDEGLAAPVGIDRVPSPNPEAAPGPPSPPRPSASRPPSAEELFGARPAPVAAPPAGPPDGDPTVPDSGPVVPDPVSVGEAPRDHAADDVATQGRPPAWVPRADPGAGATLLGDLGDFGDFGEGSDPDPDPDPDLDPTRRASADPRDPDNWYQEATATRRLVQPTAAAPRRGSPLPDPAEMPSAIRADVPEPTVHGPRWRGWGRPVALLGAGAAVLAALAVITLDRSGSPSADQAVDAAARPTVTQTAGGTAGSAADAAPAGRAVDVTAPPSLASPPARLVGTPPPGFGASPVWGVPIAAAATPLVSADGRIVTLTVDRQVALVDPVNGAVTWHVPAPDNATGPHLALIDGQQVVAVVSPETLTYWVLPSTGASGALAGASQPGGSPSGSAAAGSPQDAAAGPVTVELPAGSRVTWSGPSPLVTLGDGTAAVVRSAQVQRVGLPTGARALAADGADVLAVQGRSWIRQRAGQAPGQVLQLAIPDKATGTTPIRVENVGGSFLAGMWSGPAGPIAAVYDAHTGALAVQATFPKATDFGHATTLRTPGGDRTAVGTALLEPAEHNLSILAPSFTPVALAPGHVYANDVSGIVADLQIKGSSFKIVLFKGKNPIIPIGITTAGSASRAIVVVPSGSRWLLCALPAA
jgi:hypothetical protein